MKIKIKDKSTTQFFKVNQTQDELRDIKEIECNVCETLIKRQPGKWVGRCRGCNNIFNFFSPYTMQELVLLLDVRIIANIGGVGSGKTTVSALIMSNALRYFNNMSIYAVAPKLQQLKDTAKKELAKFFLDEEWVVRNESEWKLRNGSNINWYSADNPDTLRGVNAGKFWIIEAGGIHRKIYTQALTRIRESTLKTYNEDGSIKNDYAQIIVEANPEDNWIRHLCLLNSKAIFYTSSVKGIEMIKKLAEPVFTKIRGEVSALDIATILQATTDNPAASTTYISNIFSSLSNEEANREIYCDMSYSSNIIFSKELTNYSLKMKANEEHDWGVDGIKTKWFEGLDQGGVKDNNDPTAYILFTIEEDVVNGLPRIIPRDGFKQAGLTIEEVAAKIWKIRLKHGWSRDKAKGFVGDPSIKKLNYLGRSYVNDLKSFNIYVTAKVDNNIKYGIATMKMYAKYGMLKIPSYMTELYQELKALQWTKKTIYQNGNERIVLEPKQGNDHLVDVVRYVCVSQRINNEESAQLLRQYHSDTYRQKYVNGDEAYFEMVDRIGAPTISHTQPYAPINQTRSERIKELQNKFKVSITKFN